MNISIIGAGQVGGALARKWSQAGHQISLGVLDPSDHKVQSLVSYNPEKISALTSAEAITANQYIVLATPWPVVRQMAESFDSWQGKVIIDCTNPLEMGEDGLQLSIGFNTSGAECLAQWAAGSVVVKTLNQTGFENLANADYSQQPVMFIASDSAAEKQVVSRLVNDMGYESVDAGKLSSARLLEPYAMLWIHLAINLNQGRDFALARMQRS